jgi:hypothetical protein
MNENAHFILYSFPGASRIVLGRIEHGEMGSDFSFEFLVTFKALNDGV